MDEVLERSKYMERILKHRLPQLEFTTRHLRDEAQALDPTSATRHDDADHAAGQDEGDLAIEDERATLDPITENVARKDENLAIFAF